MIMSRQQRIITGLSVWFLLTTGWMMNEGVGYITSVFHRAAVCDETKCLEQHLMVAQMKAFELPVTKKEKTNDTKQSKIQN